MLAIKGPLGLLVKQVECSATMSLSCDCGAAKKGQTGASKPSSAREEPICLEGERLASFLEFIQRGIKSARLSDGDYFPEKMWLKQQFAIGVNEVTRVLERMRPGVDMGSSPQNPIVFRRMGQAPIIRLQAILIAADCNPRLLTRHLPSLASSRKVPLIFVKDKKEGSLRLGELVKLKTAIAIGIKARGNGINRFVADVLPSYESNLETHLLR